MEKTASKSSAETSANEARERLKKICEDLAIDWNDQDRLPLKDILTKRLFAARQEYQDQQKESQRLEAQLKTLQKLKKDNTQNRAAFTDILKNREPIMPADLAIGGEELKALGFRGRQIGETLERLLRWVYEAPAYNKRGALLKRAKTWLNQENNNEGKQS